MGDPEPPQTSKIRGWIVLGFGALALVGVVAVVGHLREGARFVELLQRARPAWLVLALALQLCTYATEAAVWHRALSRADAKRPFRELYGISVVALLTSQLVPTAGLSGQLLVVRALEGKGVPHSKALAVVILDLVGFYAAYAISVALALAAISVHGHLPGWVLATAIGVLTLAGVVGAGALWLTASGREVPLWTARIAPLHRALESLTSAQPDLVRSPRLIAWSTLLRFGNFALDATTMWACLRAVGYEAEVPAAAAGFVVASLARTVGIVPGGLGTFEAGAVAGLALFEVPLEAGLAATLLFRGFSFWLPMLPGLWLGRKVGQAATAHAAARDA